MHTGELISHGDVVYATLEQNDNPVDVVGKLCINHDAYAGRKCYICQDVCDGDSGAEERFGYRYSWSFIIDGDGQIDTTDTTYISKRPKDEPEEVVDGGDYKTFNEAPYGDVDDDPMPEGWDTDEKLPF